MKFKLKTSAYNTLSEVKSSVRVFNTLYSILYTSGVEEFKSEYTIKYNTTSLVEESVRYTILYDSIYGDSINNYRIKYTSGRDLIEYSSRYFFRYASQNTVLATTIYSIMYSSVSPDTTGFRSVYKFKYKTDGAKTNKYEYNLKYGVEFFKELTSSYVFKYTSETPYPYIIRSVVLRNSKRDSVLFYIQGAKDYSESSFYVASNLPRYQAVMNVLGESSTNLDVIDSSEVLPYNLFGESFESESIYFPVCYMLLSGVDILNNISLDIYNVETSDKSNSNKSFIFDIDRSAFIATDITLNNDIFTAINYESTYYNYDYLNFTSSSITPIFKSSSNCCFNNRINDTSSTACSPF